MTEVDNKTGVLTKIRHSLSKQKRKFIGTLILITGIAIGIFLASSFPQVAGITKLKSQLAPVVDNTTEKTEIKKQELEKFFRELTETESKDDWEKLYATINPADKKWLSIEDMTLLYKKDKYSIVSTEVVVHGVSVSDNIGYVDKTVISCKTKECTGENKIERRRSDEFVYIDGHWLQQARKEPSEKARQLAAYIYADYKTRADDRKLLADKYGGGADDLRKIIKTISTMLENDPEYLAYTEAWVNKDKAEASRPEVYVDSPDVIQQPAQQPSFSNRINCTSSNIGNYTYTNCY